MGNSTISLRSGYNYQDNSLISKENNTTINDIVNSEEEKINYIYIRKRISKKLYEEEKFNNIKNNKVPTMFEWSFKGNSVYLTGSFCNWKQFFLMKKDENGIFRLILTLKKGFHQYKFKIDNEWKYNINFPIINDNGFINNYIDTSDWEIKGEYENEEINKSLFSTSDIDLINYMKEKDINLKLSEQFYKANINYGNYIPLKIELFKEAQQFPYQCIIDCINKEIKLNKDKEENSNISEKNKVVKNKNIKKYKEENENYKNINNNMNKDNKMILYSIKFMHEQINHLHIKKIRNNNPMKISVISRFKLKFTTFLYYK